MKRILLAVSLFGLLGVAVANNYGGDDKDKKKSSCSSKKEKKSCCSKKDAKSCTKGEEKTETPAAKPTEEKK